MSSESMVERVARGLCEQDGHDPDAIVSITVISGRIGFPQVPSSTSQAWEKYVERARTVIEAMREPTGAMTVAATKVMPTYPRSQPGSSIFDDIADEWRAMISAALGEKP